LVGNCYSSGFAADTDGCEITGSVFFYATGLSAGVAIGSFLANSS